jgi:putative glycosyltransferase
MRLSIVTTLYRSANHLPEFLHRTRRAAEALQVAYEIVLVNDDSPDDSLQIALDFVSVVPTLRVIDLARNYGHYEAMLCGLRHARGERVFLIDSDLEEPPELLLDLWSKMDQTEHCDVVVACQRSRRGRSVAELGGSLFYRLLRYETGLEIPRDNLVARLMTREYVNGLISLDERPVSFDALAARLGYRYAELPAEKLPRGSTTYSLSLRTRIFVDSMLAYGSAASTIFFVAAGVIAVAGIVAATLRAPRLLQVITLFAVVVLLGGIATLCRYCYLLLEEVRYRPPRVRHLYPDE